MRIGHGIMAIQRTELNEEHHNQNNKDGDNSM